ncbi:MAG: cupin domain-containing protein [Gemmatimonadota bacterium]
MMTATARPDSPSLIAAIALVCVIGGAHAQDKPQITDVLKTALSVSAAQEVQVRQYDVPPGWATPKHYHTGHMFLYVVEGTGAMETEGQIRTARAGEVLNQFPERTMVMRNASASERLRFVVFQVGATGAPLVVLVK